MIDSQFSNSMDQFEDQLSKVRKIFHFAKNSHEKFKISKLSSRCSFDLAHKSNNA